MFETFHTAHLRANACFQTGCPPRALHLTAIHRAIYHQRPEPSVERPLIGQAADRMRRTGTGPPARCLTWTCTHFDVCVETAVHETRVFAKLPQQRRPISTFCCCCLLFFIRRIGNPHVTAFQIALPNQITLDTIRQLAGWGNEPDQLRSLTGPAMSDGEMLWSGGIGASSSSTTQL